MSVVIETTIGDVTVDLLIQDRPRTCFNFLKLCKMKYYNYCLFHRVEKDFIAQTGDPSGTGTGGHCIYHEISSKENKFLESEKLPKIKHNRIGTVSMVNNGDNLHGSQFFITLSEDLDCLDGIHTVFGYVVEGFQVLDQLNLTICNDSKRPYKDILITHTVILDDPFPDPTLMPDSSPPPPEHILNSDRIGIGEDLDENEGKTLEEIEENIKEKEAKAQATILEMVGDIPDSEIKPPENVLFVCKLNPVTKEEDLEIIFSRFGPIISCEIIRDQKTGESLQYAFIEFKNVEDCEKAYFKMDNVLIDDRRIHVDFSQSVSKLKWEARKKLMRNFSLDKSFLVKSKSDYHQDYHRDHHQDHHRDYYRDYHRDYHRNHHRDYYREFNHRDQQRLSSSHEKSKRSRNEHEDYEKEKIRKKTSFDKSEKKPYRKKFKSKSPSKSLSKSRSRSISRSRLRSRSRSKSKSRNEKDKTEKWLEEKKKEKKKKKYEDAKYLQNRKYKKN